MAKCGRKPNELIKDVRKLSNYKENKHANIFLYIRFLFYKNYIVYIRIIYNF